MKKLNYFSVLSLLFAVLFFSACSKKEEVQPDLRTSLEGTYNYKVKVYSIKENGQLEYWGSNYDQIGTLIAKKNTTDANVIDFMEGGEIAFQGNKIAQATNGVAFDIPSQNFEDDGTTYKVIGYKGNQLGTSMYDGAYFSAEKKVSAYLEIQGADTVLFFEGTKL